MMKSLIKKSIKFTIIALCIVVLSGTIFPIANYAEEQKGTVTVKYQDKEGNTISEEKSIQGTVGNEYEVARKNIKGYKSYGVTPKTAKGIYSEENIEVVFVYQKVKNEEVVVKYVDKDGNYIRRDKTIAGYVGDPYEIQAESIDGYKNIKIDGKEKGEIEEEGKEITYIYKIQDRNSKDKWTTEKTLIVIAGIIVVLIVIFLVVAKIEKVGKTNNKHKEDDNSDV